MYLELCVRESMQRTDTRSKAVSCRRGATTIGTRAPAAPEIKFRHASRRNIFTTDSSLREPLWLQVVSGTSGSGSEPSLPRGLLSQVIALTPRGRLWIHGLLDSGYTSHNRSGTAGPIAAPQHPQRQRPLKKKPLSGLRAALRYSVVYPEKQL